MWGTTGVMVRFGGATALDNVSIDLPLGHLTCVIGGDGAGKSTLLRLLAGGVEAEAGEVRRPAGYDTGYMPSTSGIYGDLSVRENLEFAGAVYGLAPAQVERRSAPLLERAGLGPFGDRLAAQLSGGMRQKLAVIRTMLHRPGLLILDEPTTGVDPVSRADMWWLISQTVAEGTAVLVSTTYAAEAERGGQVVLLEQGRLLASGRPEAVVAGVAGQVAVTDQRPEGEEARRAWRRGRTWRVWSPHGAASAPVDLQDAVTVAELEAELSR